MKQPPFSDIDSENLWAYLDGSLPEEDNIKVENALENSQTLRDELESCRKLSDTFQTFQQQNPPHWKPEAMFRAPVRSNTNTWLSMAMATIALVISLFPYIHINDDNVSIGNNNFVSEQQLQQSLNDFSWQQNLSINEKLDQLRTNQNTKNQQIVVSLLSYAEKRRRNDLLQMASWFSRQTELNQNQQRQIINWVVNEQQQDQDAITTLFNSINDETYPVSNEVQP